MYNYPDDSTLYVYSINLQRVQEYLKKDFEVLEKWFYDNYMALNPCKCEFMRFGKTNEKELFIFHKIRLKKLLLRNCLILK